MQLWKRDCPLIMKKVNRDESGITLIELLAVLALMSIVIMLGGAIHMFGQTQFRAQTESASRNNDLSYAMTVMSSDLRKVSFEQIKTAQDNLIEITDGPKYEVKSDNVLYQNDTTSLAESVGFMKVELDETFITIELVSQNSAAGVNNKNYQTTIFFREGGAE